MRPEPTDRFDATPLTAWGGGDPADARAPQALRDGLFADLRGALGARDAHVSLLPGTATAAWEAALATLLRPGERVIVVRNGPFSGRLAALVRLLGLDAEIVDVPWGQGAPVAALARRLGRDIDGAIRAVILAHVETATGVASDIAAVRRAMDESFHDALLMVDLCASFGAGAPRMDGCAIDLCVAGGSGGLPGRPGLAMVAASPRARAMMDRIAPARPAGTPDLRRALPYDLPAPLLLDLRRGLDRLLEEGCEAAARRLARLALAARRAGDALGLDLVAEPGAEPAEGVTALKVPRHVDAREVIRIARERYRTSLGAMPGPLDGRAFRIDHRATPDETALLALLAVTELALAEAGARIAFGAGIAAAQATLAPCRRTTARLGLVAA